MLTEIAIGRAAPETCCALAGSEPLSAERAGEIAHIFKALGDPTRVRLLALIAVAGEEGACICELTDPVGLSQPTVSHHMKQLADAGIVSREQRGRWAYFRLVPSANAEVMAALSTVMPKPTH